MGAVVTRRLPTCLLSGFVFPLASAPIAIRAISYIVPSRYFIALVRGIMLRGATFMDLWQPMVGLSIFSVSILTLASVRVSRIRL